MATQETWIVTNNYYKSLALLDISTPYTVKSGETVDLLTIGNNTSGGLNNSIIIRNYLAKVIRTGPNSGKTYLSVFSEHTHRGLSTLTGGRNSDADNLHTHPKFTTEEVVSDLIEIAIDDIDIDVTDAVKKSGSINQLSDITSTGVAIEEAVSFAHNSHKHNSLSGLNSGNYVHLTAAEYIEFGTLTGGSLADSLHTHDHNSLTNYSANKHIDHSTITITAGTGLLGGGTIDDDITLSIDPDEITGDHTALTNLNTTTYYHLTQVNHDTLTDGSNADLLHTHSGAGSHTIASHSDTSGTGPELDNLTDGTNADSLHVHTLNTGITDVTATSTEINDALDGISGNVTFTNLNTLTGGGNADSLHSHAGGGSVHNNLIGLQGGNPSDSDEYYHLSAVDYNNMITLTDSRNADDLHNHSFATTAYELPLGQACDGDWTDGLFDWTTATETSCAIDEISETMSYLAPADATSMDGQTMTTSGVSTYTGRLSAGNTNYPGGVVAGDTYTSKIINDGTFSILSPTQASMFNKADEGDLIYYINGVQNDTYDLATSFVEGERAGSQSYPPATGGAGNLRIDSVAYYNSFPKWQIGNATMIVVPGDLRQGYNYFDLKHDLSTDQDATTLEFFYDNDAGSNPSVNTPTVAENTPVIQEISGVRFYDRGSTFDLDVIGSDCFDNVYHQTSPLTYTSSSSTMGFGDIDYDDGSVGGVTDPPVIGETMTVTNKLITTPSSNIRSIDSRATVTPRDPYGSYSAGTSASENRLVDGYNTTSTVIYEYFDDENRRLPSAAYDSIPGSITGQWTSTDDLSNGEAQVFNGRLYYPTINFTSGYLPGSQTANYSSFSGNQVYLRSFYDNGNPHSSGSLEFANLTSSDIGAVGAGNINVEIKLPTQTGWLDLGTAYNSGTFTGIDGDGCRTSQSGDDWAWTAGTFTTSNSGWMIIVRVTFRNSTDNITQIRELGW